jgi:hypothetical protein
MTGVREPFHLAGIDVPRERMKDRAFHTAALAMVLATGAFAQVTVSDKDNPKYAKPDESRGMARLASFKIPATPPWDTKYKAPPAVSGLQMPEYRVNELRPEVFRDYDLYTKTGREDLSFHRHPGLLVGNPFKLNAGLAYETFLRDDWNNTKSDYFDMAHAMAAGGDPGEGHMIVKAIQDEDVKMRAEADDAASAPAIGRFQIASPETGTRLLELPEETIDIPFLKRTW